MSFNREQSDPTAVCAFCHNKIDLQKSAFTENEKCGHRFHSRCVSTVAEPDPCPECALREPSTFAVRDEEPARFNSQSSLNNNTAQIAHTESNNKKAGLDEAEINHLQTRAAEINEEERSKGTLLT